MNYFLILILGFSLVFDVELVSSQSSSIALDCGSKGGKDDDGRTWGDDAKYLSSTKDSIQAQAGHQDPSLYSKMPFMNARIFKSSATYNLPMEPKKRYLVRFYFYPSTYSDYKASDSYFSVTAGGVTLMNNFSADVTCRALTQAYLVKEYSLAPSDSDNLQVMFTPSTKHSNAFAFVNGIELIPMPDLFGVAATVGYGSANDLDISEENLESLFRINVAGQIVLPRNDSGGLYRSWYNDDPYIAGAALGTPISDERRGDPKIDYKNVSTAAAPEVVYKTARHCGLLSSVNINVNLSWIFQAEPNFTYLVRLHFCEFTYNELNQRVFNIAINNQTAYSDADIIGWTQKPGVPVYKDFLVAVNDGPGEEEAIKIVISPSNNMKPEFFDAQLNGIEIFKVDDGNKNLAGKNPEPSEMMRRTENEQPKTFTKPKTDYTVVGEATGGAVAAFVAIALLAFLCTKKRKGHVAANSHTSNWLPVYGNSSGGSKSNNNSSVNLSTLAQGLSRHFSISEIKQATMTFDESNVIGVGGFGKVYKGVIDGGTMVAIKRSNPSSEQGINEFQTEIEMLSKLRHKHLVSLIGFCEDGGEMCLVYDHMARGTFREHIYSNKKSNLSWKQRLEICIGAARGLHYLHTGAKYTIIHRDVKTTNILLDEKWVAKVSDFGLSKTGPDLNQGHVSTVVKGSFGYLDPEYFRRQQLTEKSDVYSFGVVLFEALCSRPALNPSLPKEQVSLADWAINCHKKGSLDDIIDPHLKGEIDPECLTKFAETAVKCLSDQGIDRPHMGDVLWNLEFALQLQETADGGGSKRGSSSASDQGSVHSRGPSSASIVSEHELNEVDKEESAIFSQLVNPTGR